MVKLVLRTKAKLVLFPVRRYKYYPEMGDTKFKQFRNKQVPSLGEW